MIMKVTRGRISSARSKWGFMSFVALANGTKRDMEGSLSVLSTPSGIPATFSGNGRSMTEAVVLERELEMKGRFAWVVKTVRAAPRRRRRCERWRIGMVWPFDMNGKITI